MVTSLFVAIAAPLVVGVALMAGDRLGRPLAQATAWALAFGTSFLTLVAFIVAAATDASIDRRWVPQIGMRLHFDLDGISAPLVIMSAAVTLLAVAVSSRQRPKSTPGLFYGSVLTVLAGAVTALAVRDAIGFFVAFEVVLVPMWVLIDRYGDPRAQPRRAGLTFALYTVLGSMLMLLGILVLSIGAGTTDLTDLAHGAAAGMPFRLRMIAAVLLCLGLAVKVPLFPLHSWLPRAHTAAPTAGSMLLAAVLLKLGTYGFVRLVVLPLPQAWDRIAPVVGVLSVIGILWGGLVCLVERDLKKVIAWSSVAHMGFVMLALAAGTKLGLQAALYGNLAHGVISALLFAAVGAVKERRGPVDIDEPMLGLRNRDPRLGFALVLGLAGAMGLPGLAGYWGEALGIFAAWDAPGRPEVLFHVLAVLAAIGAALAGAYAIRLVRSVWAGEAEVASSSGAHSTQGPVADAASRAEHVRGLEWIAIAALVLAVVVLGIAPSWLMHIHADALAPLFGGTR